MSKQINNLQDKKIVKFENTISNKELIVETVGLNEDNRKILLNKDQAIELLTELRNLINKLQ